MHPTRAHRAETVVQVVILLAIGGMAAAASFTHVHDLTVAHGQPDWIGWANAVVLELMSIAAGLELRRRKRTRNPLGFTLGVLIAAVCLSLAAQVAEAEPTVWGWIVAALPAAGFLALVKIILSRATPDHQDTNTAPTVEPTAPATTPAPGPAPPAVPEHLVTGARMAAFHHQQRNGHPITAQALAEHLAVPHDTAAHLLAAVGHPNGTNNGTPSSGGRP